MSWSRLPAGLGGSGLPFVPCTGTRAEKRPDKPHTVGWDPFHRGFWGIRRGRQTRRDIPSRLMRPSHAYFFRIAPAVWSLPYLEAVVGWCCLKDVQNQQNGRRRRGRHCAPGPGRARKFLRRRISQAVPPTRHPVPGRKFERKPARHLFGSIHQKSQSESG